MILGKLLDFPEFVKWSLSHRIVGKIQSDDTTGLIQHQIFFKEGGQYINSALGKVPT